MDIIVNHAVMHIIGRNPEETQISRQELDIDSDACHDFLVKSIKKLFNNNSAKEGLFLPDSEVFRLFNSFKNGDAYFTDMAARIGEILAELTGAHEDLPAGVVILAQFEVKTNEYLCLLRISYKEYYTHEFHEEEGAQLVKFYKALPLDGGKVEEACLIPYEPVILQILEKPRMVDGEPTDYFSKLFLQCQPELSKKEAAKIIEEITDEITEKYYNGNPEAAAKVKIAFIEESLEEEGSVSIHNAAARAFAGNEEARAEYIELAKDAGIKPEIDFGEKFVKQNFGFQKFKAQNGVELKLPAELCDDSAYIEFLENDDGGLTIVLKNLYRS